jgi:HAD superfamily hydrolase (TIGR01509 family)
MQAVLFDMDGVVVDSERFWVELEEGDIFPAALADATVRADETTGMNYREIYDYLADRYEMAVEKEEWIRLYDQAAEELYGERVSLMEGFEGLVEELYDRGVAVGLVSSSPTDWIGSVLERFDLKGDFDLIVSADELPVAGKPEPDVFLHAAEELGIEPDDCVVVEDSANGARAANAAGMYTIGYRNESDSDQDLSVAVEVVGTPAELRERLIALV